MSIQPIMKNKLQGWLAPNTLTEDPDDRILILKSAGTVNDERIYEEMRNEDTGLRKETMVHVVTLYERIVARFLMNGNNVNTGLFYAIPRFTGIIQEGRWNPLINDIYVDFTQNRVLREEIRNTQVEILGEKPSSVYFASAQDCSTEQTDGHLSPGRNFRLTGSYIRVDGDNENVGITLRNLSDDTVTKVEPDMFGTNNPSEVIFIAPTGLKDGEYELTLTTQYSGSTKRLLKTPRSISRTVYVGTKKDDDDDRPVIE